MQQILHQFINRHWYAKHLTWFALLLWPISFIFKIISEVRKRKLLRQVNGQAQVDIPVVVVGNISVGGVGKTPLVETMVRRLAQEGYRPGIVSRGYGGASENYPVDVTAKTFPAECGDEPYMLHQILDCPVVVSPNRVEAVTYLKERHPEVDIVISDDGLQHYKMFRDIEISVVDASRGLGNGLTLPAGPLREPASRLKSVDYVIASGGGIDFQKAFVMQIKAISFVALMTKENLALGAFMHKKVHAVAGIGNPCRFYQMLRNLGCEVIEHSFPDHHQYVQSDFDFKEVLPIIMTSKDAVKCRGFMRETMHYLAIGVELDDVFWSDFYLKLKK